MLLRGTGCSVLVDLEFGNVDEQFRLTRRRSGRSRAPSPRCSHGRRVAIFLAGARSGAPATGSWPRRLLTFAFLPVVYSRIAVTDVGTCPGRDRDLRRAARVRGGPPARLRDRGRGAWASRRRLQVHGRAGAAAARDRGARAPPRRRPAPLAGRRLGARWPRARVRACSTPFFFVLDFDELAHQLRGQAEAAGDDPRSSARRQGGFSYYFDRLGWGFGWARGARRARGRGRSRSAATACAACCSSVPIALFALHSDPDALLRPLAAADLPGAGDAGGGRARAARPSSCAARRGGPTGRCSRHSPPRVLAQPVAADVRTARVLGGRTLAAGAQPLDRELRARAADRRSSRRFPGATTASTRRASTRRG